MSTKEIDINKIKSDAIKNLITSDEIYNIDIACISGIIKDGDRLFSTIDYEDLIRVSGLLFNAMVDVRAIHKRKASGTKV